VVYDALFLQNKRTPPATRKPQHNSQTKSKQNQGNKTRPVATGGAFGAMPPQIFFVPPQILLHPEKVVLNT